MTLLVSPLPFRVLHCDDSDLCRALVREMLRPHPEVELVGQTVDHADAVACAAALEPDLVLLDLDAGREEQVVSRLRDVCTARVLVLSGDAELAHDPIVRQADGFVSKAAGLAAITQAVLAAGAAHDALWLDRLRQGRSEDRLVPFALPIAELATDAVVEHALELHLAVGGGGHVGPQAYMGAAARLGLTTELDRWVLREAARLAAHGHAVRLRLSDPTLAADPTFGAALERELLVAGAKPGLVGIEISERALMQDEALAAAFVAGARGLGCEVTLTGVGTNGASSPHLGRVPVDGLQLDADIVRSLRDPDAERIVRGVTRLAAVLDLATAADGVEDRQTAERLLTLGVGYAQGAYLGPAGPAAAVLSASWSRSAVTV